MAAQGLSVFPVTPSTSSSQQSSREPIERFVRLNSEYLSNSFVGMKLSIRPSKLSLIASKRHKATVATVIFSLPTTKTEGVADDKKPKFSARSIKSFAMAELEARKLKYPNTGTEALIMGILVEGTSLAAKYMRKMGITLFKVREETVKVVGKSDLYIFSPEHPPMTGPVQRALDWAVDEKMKAGESGEITTSHMLLGIWAQEESAGHKILAAFGFDDDKAKELAKTMDKDIILSFK